MCVVDAIVRDLLDSPDSSDEVTVLHEPVSGLPTVTLPHNPRVFHCGWTDEDRHREYAVRFDGIAARNSVHVYVSLGVIEQFAAAVREQALGGSQTVSRTVYDTSGDDTTYCPLCLSRVERGDSAIRINKHRDKWGDPWLPNLWLHVACLPKLEVVLESVWEETDTFLGDAL